MRRERQEQHLQRLDPRARERADQKTAGQSADFKEGVAAFLEKRPARYEGK